MFRGLIYRNAFIYEMTMVAGYGRHYGERYRAITELIPHGASVLDLCCGPGILYRRYLRNKSVSYTGLDINEKFVRNLVRCGALAQVHDLRSNDPLPAADYVVMQASLYHFLPDPGPILSRMIAAARSAVIVSEPIRNLSSSRMPALSWLARTITNPGTGPAPERFTEETLIQLFSQLEAVDTKTFLTGGGRERVFVCRVDEMKRVRPPLTLVSSNYYSSPASRSLPQNDPPPSPI